MPRTVDRGCANRFVTDAILILHNGRCTLPASIPPSSRGSVDAMTLTCLTSRLLDPA